MYTCKHHAYSFAAGSKGIADLRHQQSAFNQSTATNYDSVDTTSRSWNHLPSDSRLLSATCVIFELTITVNLFHSFYYVTLAVNVLKLCAKIWVKSINVCPSYSHLKIENLGAVRHLELHAHC